MLSVVALGFALRFYHYGREPDLWHDEAATVLNIIRKSFGELLGPLYVSATGPPAFFWLEKCMTLMLGDSLHALRLFPLLASCLGLFVFVRVAGRTLAPLGAFSAILLVACSDRLLWHAAEARHYSSDFLIAVALLSALQSTQAWPVPRRALLFALLAPFVVFFSYPGVFLCGGIFAALFLSAQRDRRWGALLLFGATTALAFAAFYFLTVRVQRTAAMDAAWVHTFPDWARPWTVPFWAVKSTVNIFDYMIRPIGGILIVPAIFGAIHFWGTERRDLVLFAIVPMMLAMCAAFVGAYPYTGARTMVFALPALFLLLGAGIDTLAGWRPTRASWKFAAVLGVAVPLLAAVGFAGYRVVVPWPRAATAAASAYVVAHRQNDEPVTSNHWEYEYYFRHLGTAFTPELALLEKSNSANRAWIVISGRDLETRDELIAASLRGWRIEDRHEFARTSVLLASRNR